MPTAREHMQADIDYFFAQDGEEVIDVVIDGMPQRAMAGAKEVRRSELTEVVEERWTLTLPASSGAARMVGQEVDVEGTAWSVGGLETAEGLLLVVHLTRNVG